MTRPASRSWFRAALSAVVFFAIAFIQFRILSWSLSDLVGDNLILGPFRTSDVAALVMILIAIYQAIFLADGRLGFRLFPVLAGLPAATRRLFVIVSVAILIAISVAQVGVAYFASRLWERGAVSASDLGAPMNLVPGLSFVVGDPILLLIGCLLPLCMIASVFVLVGQIVGPIPPAAASGSESEPTAARL